MSADNGIYILKTPKPPIKRENTYINQHGLYEYRVAHCQAIENIDHSDLCLALYFSGCKIYDSSDEAWKFARAQAEDCDVLEYGISEIEHAGWFPNITSKAAAKALDCYVGAIPVDCQ